MMLGTAQAALAPMACLRKRRREDGVCGLVSVFIIFTLFVAMRLIFMAWKLRKLKAHTPGRPRLFHPAGGFLLRKPDPFRDGFEGGRRQILQRWSVTVGSD